MADITLEQLQTLLTQLGVQSNPGGTLYVPVQPLSGVPVATPAPVIIKPQAPGTQSTSSGGSVPAPTIAQSLVGIPTGYQFSFTQSVVAPYSTQVIDHYSIYRGLIPNFQAASLNQTVTASIGLIGAIVVTDLVNTASNFEYFYWVIAVDGNGNQSVPVPAQTGAVIGSVGSIPSTIGTPFKVVTTTSSVTLSTSPSAYFARADNSITKVGQTSQACTSLPMGNNTYFFPYWNEVTQTLNYVKASDLVIPNITGITLAAASSQYISTATVGAIGSAFTVEMWFKGAAAGGLFDHSAPQVAGVTTSSVLMGQVTSGGEVEVSVYNGSSWTSLTTSGASVLDSTWHHIVFAYSGTTGSIFVDGVNTSNGTTFWTNGLMGSIASTSGSWHFGVAAGLAAAPLTSNTFLTGSISLVSLYTTALSTTQALAHMQAYGDLGLSFYLAELTYDSATNLWKLNETSGTSAADSIGSNTGTYRGSPTLNQTSAVVTVLGTPAIAWPFNYFPALQQQSLRNRVPLSNGAITASTASATTSGGGGSSNGGSIPQRGGGCFTGDTLVKTKRGDIRIDEVMVSDRCLTAKGNWCRVIKTHYHEAERRTLHKLPGGGLSTHNHKLIHNGEWVQAGTVYTETEERNEPVYTLSMFSREPEENSLDLNTERSFTLANGIVVTNTMFNKL